MSDNQNPALAELAAHNQVVMIGDLDHRNQAIPDSVRAQIPAMAANGVKHLFLEHDPLDVSVSGIIKEGGAYAEMVKEAQASGIAIHLMDDRSRQRERDAHYPQERAYVQAHDTYRENPEALIAGSANPERMRAYLDERAQNRDADVAFRNVRMVENIADVMDRYPDQKALVMVGNAHVFERNDMDEGLRLRGYQTVTAQIYAPGIASSSLIDAAVATDKSDFVLRAETGAVSAYRIPDTNKIHGINRLPEGTEIPWANQEPVADRNHPAMLCALDAVKNRVDCSWNRGTDQAQNPPVSRAETGQMTAPPTQGQPAVPEVNGPLR